MSDTERPTGHAPREAAASAGDESAYPGDPATQRSDGPEDPADVQQPTEGAAESEGASGRRETERTETLREAEAQGE